MWNRNERYLIGKLIKENIRDFTFNLHQSINPVRLKNSGATDKLPPAGLRIRVGEPRRERYLGNGAKLCSLLLSHLNKYRCIDEFQKILDWGCGCGRVTRHMLCHVSACNLYGCDIDQDAISWMNKNFPEPLFTSILPYPPTGYEENYFDLIYGISVFTHLDEELQFKWLNELRRICNPDGLVAVSVHGGVSRKRPELARKLEENGVADMKGNKKFLFKHLENQDYYRETKHSREYILREWSRYFYIIDFVENGLGRQDLVIMRQKK